ncbi:MAG: hypothetical protein II445_01870, partial [Muribaculaceae bacterium]|nr:hypothetical protein [Muribaculaceae bacterium]
KLEGVSSISRATGTVCEQRTSLNFKCEARHFSVAMVFSNNYKQLQTILIYHLASGALCAMLHMEIKEAVAKL